MGVELCIYQRIFSYFVFFSLPFPTRLLVHVAVRVKVVVLELRLWGRGKGYGVRVRVMSRHSVPQTKVVP